MQPLLQVENLKLDFRTSRGFRPALLGVTYEVAPGEIVAMVGESGSGKTVCALASIGLLPPNAVIRSGRIRLDGKTLVDGSVSHFTGVRGARIAMIFQEPMTCLNPALTVGEQVSEALVRHKGRSWKEAKAEAVSVLDRVGIPDAARRAMQYVHQLSGGMRQRVMIASAISCGPELLIADEPTTALDVTIQAQILDLIRELKEETGMGVLFITHDLGVVAEIAERTYVMYGGRVVEEGATVDILKSPLMPYTQGLLDSLPRNDRARARLKAIPGTVLDLMSPPPGCGFAPRCADRETICDAGVPPLEAATSDRATRCIRWREVSGRPAPAPVPTQAPSATAAPATDVILEVEGLVKHFPTASSLFGEGGRVVRAVDGVDFTVRRGEVLALVGESGSGKTTIGRCILRLTKPMAGKIRFNGRDVLAMRAKEMAALRRHMQIVFQDPFSSLNPKLTIGETLAEPIRAHGLASGQGLKDRVAGLLTMVGLDPAHTHRYPANFSGGQRQRIAIARALALGPEFIVADEAVSALDVSIRAQVTNLLQDLKQELSLTFLFIAHDLALVRQISDRVVILYLGRIMEEGPVEEVFSSPRHPYTEALLSSIPVLDPDQKRDRIVLMGDVPSSIAPPSGCVFRTRCPLATADCAKIVPPRVEVGAGHSAACLYAR